MSKSASPTLRRSGNRFLATGGGIALIAATAAGNASGFLFHVTVSRQLDPSDYGALGALLGILVVLAVPVGAVQVAITKKVTARRRPSSEAPVPIVVGPLLAQSLLWGMAASGALLAAAPLLKTFLHLPSLTPAVMVAIFIVPMAVGLVPKAVLIAELRFRLVAGALLAGALARLLLGTVLVRAGSGLNGAIAASVFGEMVTAALVLPALRAFLSPASDTEPVRLRRRETSVPLVAFTGFWLLSAVDIVLARHYLPRGSSGFYAAASTAAGAAMFLPAAISLIAFPHFAQSRTPTPEARQKLARALVIVASLSFFTAIVILVASNTVISVLFGEVYLASTAVVGIRAFSYACLGSISILMHFHLAMGSRAASALPWAGVVAATVAISFLHSSLLSIALVIVCCTGCVLVAMLYAAFAPQHSDPAQPLGDTDLWAEEPALDLTLVVPFYNPGPRVVDNLAQLSRVLLESGTDFEIIAVSDGSNDGSADAVAAIRVPRLRCMVLGRNVGKGRALRVGLSAGRGRYLGFIDADGDISPTLLDPFLTLMRLYEADVVLGSKRHPMSDVLYPPTRRLYSWGYQQLVRVLFRLNIRDTQTGLKLARRQVWAAVLPRMVEKRFAFDLEFLVVARHLGYRGFFEAPVRIGQRFTSTVSFGTVWRMLADTFAIFYRLRILRYYDDQSEESSTQLPPGSAGTRRRHRVLEE